MKQYYVQTLLNRKPLLDAKLRPNCKSVNETSLSQTFRVLPGSQRPPACLS